jgi:hypothetical protein
MSGNPAVAAPVDATDSAYLLCHGLRACFRCIKRRFETEKRQMSHPPVSLQAFEKPPLFLLLL